LDDGGNASQPNLKGFRTIPFFAVSAGASALRGIIEVATGGTASTEVALGRDRRLPFDSMPLILALRRLRAVASHNAENR
jgi:hypothetical protein